MEFSVIVPTLNEEDFIEDCLESISNQTFPRNKYEIIVSDGMSTDNTVHISKNYADRIVLSEKRGIWCGRNYGAKFSKGKYLVFIDADTRLQSDYLDLVYNYLERGVIGLTMGFELETKSPKVHVLGYLGLCYWWLNSKINNGCLIVMNLCILRNVFIKIGGFKEFALEDAALERELRREGRTLFIIKRKVVTSARLLETLGAIGLCRYYVELGLLDSGKLKRNHILKYIKNKGYKPIYKFDFRNKRNGYENIWALRDRVRRVENKGLKLSRNFSNKFQTLIRL
ncbi:MAG: glycosyltransferase [Methanotrichaceae archaeon]|nr:glycosyltransferase [Methanotrichaceae archaeon]